MIEPSDHITGEAAQAWQHACETAALTEAHRPLLELYAVAYARWRDAESKLAELGPVVKSPSGFPVQNPYLSVANTAMRQTQQLAKQLGIAATSKRDKPPVQKPATKSAVRIAPSGDDEIETMLKQLGSRKTA